MLFSRAAGLKFLIGKKNEHPLFLLNPGSPGPVPWQALKGDCTSLWLPASDLHEVVHTVEFSQEENAKGQGVSAEAGHS